MKTGRYQDRTHAGQQLAQSLARIRGRKDAVVLALPRGGVPVADVVARELRLPMQLLLVRKLGAPNQQELAIGATAMVGGQFATVFNASIIETLGLSRTEIEQSVALQQAELKRRYELYLGDDVSHGSTPLIDRVAVIVDDGLATGATMRAAVAAIRELKPAQILVAVPVAPLDTVQQMQSLVDEVICPLTPTSFQSVSNWYDDFSEVTDRQVKDIIGAADHESSSRTAL